MENVDLCKGCKNHCCTRPSLTMTEYLAMYRHAGERKMLEFEPTWMAGGNCWMFAKSGCPAATEQGCILKGNDRPLMCRLFPFYPIPCTGPKEEDKTVVMMLNLRCPNWKLFGPRMHEAEQEYRNAT